MKLVPGPVDKDQHGQLIRYVFSGNTFVNYTLVREGLASVDTSVDSSSFEACLGEFTSAQLGAQVELLGMWQNAAIGGGGFAVPPACNSDPNPAIIAQPAWVADACQRPDDADASNTDTPRYTAKTNTRNYAAYSRTWIDSNKHYCPRRSRNLYCRCLRRGQSGYKRK